jgi:FkbM family methyltransferase
MSIRSYAQNFEDVMLWRALGNVEKGQYIDIGAQDPVVDSVSLMFYERGWRGIHVEPTPAYAELLRRSRPDEIVIQAAVAEINGIMSFYEFPDTGLSTGNPDIAEKHVHNGFTVREIVVPGVTLDEVFSRKSGEEVHWLKIDVEGGEEQVLTGWIRSTLRLKARFLFPKSNLTSSGNHLFCARATNLRTLMD